MEQKPTKSLVYRLVKPEMIIALAAAIISICALVVSVLEVRIMREQQRAAVWPHIGIGKSFDGEKLTINIVNNGIGPAIIKEIEITVDGKPKKDWHEVLSALVGERFSDPIIISSMHDHVMRPGDHITALTVSSPNPVETFSHELGRVGIRLCYCSVYGNCWLVSGKVNGAKDYRKISVCPIDKSRQFEW